MVKKLIFDTDEQTWAKVKQYKADNKLKTNNDAVNELVKKGLEIPKV